MSVKLLASQLKRDIPMEWGGGVAHSALALYSQDAGKWKYTDEQRRQMALDRANSIIKVWDGKKAEGNQ